MKTNRRLNPGIMLVMAFVFALTIMAVGSMPVFAESDSEGETRTLIAPISVDLEDEGVDAIAITVIVPPAPARPTPAPETRRVFPVNVAEGYNYEGVRELIRIYELLPNESPEWIRTDSFERNGYYYRLAEITRRVDVAHSIREHTEVLEIHTERNDLAAVIAGLYSTMEFEDEDGYVGVLHLNIHSIEMTQAGTRSTSRTVSQVREFPHLSSPDISLIPQTVTANNRTYALADVNWQTNTVNPIDFNSVAQTFTAHATYTRTATSTVSTGYTTRAEYSGTLTRVSTGETRFVAQFIGTPIVSPIVSRPPSPAENQSAELSIDGNAAADGNGTNGTVYEDNTLNGENQSVADVRMGDGLHENVAVNDNGLHFGLSENGYSQINGGAGAYQKPTGEDNIRGFPLLLILPLALLAVAAAALTVFMLRFKKKADTLQTKAYEDSGKTLSSRMASVISQDRREIAEATDDRYVSGYLDEDMDFEEVDADEGDDADDMSWLDEELDSEEPTDTDSEST